MNCLDPEMLERYVSDQADEAEVSRIESHLKVCPKCALRVSQAMENESLLSEVRKVRGPVPPVPVKTIARSAAVGLGLIEDAQRLLGKRYRVVKKVGSGGAGEVFQAVDTILERSVAIKFLRQKPSDSAGANRWNEAKMMGQFNHANIAHIHEIGQSQGWRFIVMEWVDGVPLTEAWAPMNVEQRLKIFLDILNAVAAAHERGIVHRDLKPSNLLVTLNYQVKVLDFGLALAVDTPGPVEKRVYRGTPAYSAPEQITSPDKISPATDVFALGILLYEMLTETLPFPQTEAKELFRAILKSYPELPNAVNAEVPLPLQNICLKCLEKEPAKRYADAAALADDLNRYLKGEIVWSKPSFLVDKVQQEVYYHRQKLKSWFDNDLITQGQFDRLEDLYERIVSPPDSTILEAKRLTVSQVFLYLGMWTLVLGGLVLCTGVWEGIPNPYRPLPMLGAGVGAMLIAHLLWGKHEKRLALGALAVGNLLVPLAVLMCMVHWRIYSPMDFSIGYEEWLRFPSLTFGNGQLAIAVAFGLVYALVYFRATRSSVFSALTVIFFLGLLTVLYIQNGLSHWSPATVAGRYLIPSAGLFVFGMLVDRSRHGHYAWPLTSAGLIGIVGSLSVIARSDVTLFGWLHWIPASLNPQERMYLSFVANGLVYLVLGNLSRELGTPTGRRIGALFNWLGPVHILIPLWILDGWGTAHREIYRFLLPAVSMVLVLGSVFRQRKTYLLCGLLGLGAAVGVLTREYFKSAFAWPVGLLALGLVWIVVAWLVPRWRMRAMLRRKE